MYSAGLGVSGKVDTVLRDYDQTGTIASGPLPFVSTEGRVYRTVIAEAVDGTYTIETYKQSSEATETGTIPSVTTEGRIYSAVMSVEESDAVTSTRYVQAGEMETGGETPMIEQKGLAVFNKAVAETITRAVCTISGKDYTLPIKSVTVEGATFKVNIYLDDTLSGTVTNTKLYDKDGNLLIQRQDVVPKPEEKNLLVVFQLELREVAL